MQTRLIIKPEKTMVEIDPMPDGKHFVPLVVVIQKTRNGSAVNQAKVLSTYAGLMNESEAKSYSLALDYAAKLCEQARFSDIESAYIIANNNQGVEHDRVRLH